MNPSYRDIDFSQDADCELLARWFNQEIESMSPSGQIDTAETVRESYSWPRGKPPGFEAFFICLDGAPVGYASFFMNPPHKLSAEQVLWPSVAIGDPAYRRLGLVRHLGYEICRRAQRYGATHIEVGVFDSNAAMFSLLSKYGFTPIGKAVTGQKKIPATHFIRPLPE